MRQPLPRIATTVALLAVAIAYYAFHGPGPSPSERAMDLPWWRPLGLAQTLDWALLAPLQDISAAYDEARHFGRWEPRGLIPFGIFASLPVLLTGLGFRVFRSPPARGLVLGTGLTLCAFVYYGWLDLGTWEDYAWRWPIALFVTSTYLATFALAPAWVEWLQPRSRALQLAAVLLLLVPIYFLTTEVTGTNPELEWNLSPWPVITLYGFLLFGLLFGVVHLAAGVGLFAGGRLTGLAGVALAAAVAAGVAVVLRGIPFAVTDLTRVAVLAIPAAVLAGLGARRPGEQARRRALCLCVAGAAILFSVKAGQWQAEFFQAEARNEISPRVIAALEAHMADRQMYPLELKDLVPDYLSEIPNPRVGWFGEEGEAFMYIDLGDSYLLEFASAMWVQCHYSPPYLDEEEGESLEASWSCEPRPPRLW
ncbi:MAG: hypothetical protein ACQGVK_14895 [Myxococcota bacterium]